MRRLAASLPLLLVLAAVALAVALPLLLAYERGQAYGPGSSQRSDADGLRALYLLLEEGGERPRRLHRPAPTQARALLVCVRPQLAEGDDQLVEWVQQGGVLLLAEELPAPVPSPSPSPSAQPSPSPSPGSTRKRSQAHAEPHEPAPLRHALGLQLQRGPAPASLPAESRLGAALPGWPADEAARHYWAGRPKQAQVLLGSEQRPVLVEWRLGAGRVLALSDAAWLGNAGLPRGQRLALALALLREPGLPVWFDEYRHGLVEEPGLAYVLARYGLLPTAFALLALLALLAWHTTPAEAPAAPGGVERAPVRDSLVEARAGLYAQTLKGREALRLIEHDLHQGLVRALGGRPLSWDEAARRLEARRPALGRRLAGLRREIEGERRGAPTPLPVLLPLARRVAQFLQEVR